jgi:hypothetical protein
MRERGSIVAGLCKLEEDAPFGKYAKAAGEAGQHRRGWAGWAEIWGELFPNKFWIFLNIQRLWKFVGGDLGGILIWGFFINSSGLLKDFRKIW